MTPCHLGLGSPMPQQAGEFGGPKPLGIAFTHARGTCGGLCDPTFFYTNLRDICPYHPKESNLNDEHEITRRKSTIEITIDGNSQTRNHNMGNAGRQRWIKEELQSQIQTSVGFTDPFKVTDNIMRRTDD